MPRYDEPERVGGAASGAVVRRTPLELANARKDKEKLQDASRIAPKQDAFVPPKMEPGEDSSRYAERVRKAREAHNQKKAMK